MQRIRLPLCCSACPWMTPLLLGLVRNPAPCPFLDSVPKTPASGAAAQAREGPRREGWVRRLRDVPPVSRETPGPSGQLQPLHC